jgi:hypothetical protein
MSGSSFGTKSRMVTVKIAAAMIYPATAPAMTNFPHRHQVATAREVGQIEGGESHMPTGVSIAPPLLMLVGDSCYESWKQ